MPVHFADGSYQVWKFKWHRGMLVNV